MTFTKGQQVEFDYYGEMMTGTVVAWYVDLFTGHRMVGVDMDLDGLSPEIPGPDSEFAGFEDDSRIDMEEGEFRPVS